MKDFLLMVAIAVVLCSCKQDRVYTCEPVNKTFSSTMQLNSWADTANFRDLNHPDPADYTPGDTLIILEATYVPAFYVLTKIDTLGY